MTHFFQKLSLLTIGVCFSGFTFAQDDWIDEDNPKFSLSHPESWMFSDDGEMGTTCILMTDFSDSTDIFTEI